MFPTLFGSKMIMRRRARKGYWLSICMWSVRVPQLCLFSLLQSGFQRPDAIQRLQGIFLATSDRLYRESETAVPFLI